MIGFTENHRPVTSQAFLSSWYLYSRLASSRASWILLCLVWFVPRGCWTYTASSLDLMVSSPFIVLRPCLRSASITVSSSGFRVRCVGFFSLVLVSVFCLVFSTLVLGFLVFSRGVWFISSADTCPNAMRSLMALFLALVWAVALASWVLISFFSSVLQAPIPMVETLFCHARTV